MHEDPFFNESQAAFCSVEVIRQFYSFRKALLQRQMAELEAAEKHAIDMLTGRYTSVVESMESLGDTSFEDAEGAIIEEDFASFQITEPRPDEKDDIVIANNRNFTVTDEDDKDYDSCEEFASGHDEDDE